ncbi:HIT family protein [Rhodococcus sp. DMU2021]
MPRIHVPDIWTLDRSTAEQLADATTRLAAAVKRAVNPDGLNVIQSNGSAASQTVFHLHIHLVPRWEGDPIGHIWPPESNYSEKEKDDAWEALRVECRKASNSRARRAHPLKKIGGSTSTSSRQSSLACPLRHQARRGGCCQLRRPPMGSR